MQDAHLGIEVGGIRIIIPGIFGILEIQSDRIHSVDRYAAYGVVNRSTSQRGDQYRRNDQGKTTEHSPLALQQHMAVGAEQGILR